MPVTGSVPATKRQGLFVFRKVRTCIPSYATQYETMTLLQTAQERSETVGALARAALDRCCADRLDGAIVIGEEALRRLANVDVRFSPATAHKRRIPVVGRRRRPAATGTARGTPQAGARAEHVRS